MEDRGLPLTLVEFYQTSEGVGLEVALTSGIRFCTYAELAWIRWEDLHILGDDEPEPGWEQFRGVRIGVGAHWEEYIFIKDAPVAPEGAIMVFGLDIPGPGGKGVAAIEPSLVLSLSFSKWLESLEGFGWEEIGIQGGFDSNMGERRRRKALLKLNPDMLLP